MLKKKLQSLFLLPPEVLSYFDLKSKKYYFFSLKGWYMIPFFKPFSFIYNNLLKLTRLFFCSSFVNINTCFGCVKTYFKYLQLRGRSFKYLFSLSTLVLKFGFSHKLYYIAPKNTKITLLTKSVLKVSSKSLQTLKHIFFDLHLIRKFDKYKGKGLLYYKDILILKASSKKTKV